MTDMVVWVLILYWMYFLVAFALRSWIHVRRTGSSPIRKVHAKRFSIEWSAAMLLGVGATLGLAAPLLDLADLSQPIAALNVRAAHASGFTLFAAGLILMFYAQLTMGSSWRIGVDSKERTELVTRGPFSVVRNPIYSSGALMSIGLILVLPDPWLVASFLVQVVGVELQVRGVEEPLLEQKHGTTYSKYAASVGRFVPGIGKIAEQRRM